MIRNVVTVTLAVILLVGVAWADALDNILARLQDADPERQAEALNDLLNNRALILRGDGKQRTAVAVAGCLEANHEVIRYTAVDFFEILELPGGRKLVAAQWDDPSGLVRAGVVEVCVRYAFRDRMRDHAVSWIRKGLEDPHWGVRARAAWMIDHRFEKTPKVLAGPLANALAARDKKFEKENPKEVIYVRECLTAALVKAGRDASPAVGALIGVLEEDGPVVRANAATALANVWGKASAAETSLVTLLKDKTPEVRRAAAFALTRIGPSKSTTPRALAKVLKDKDPETCVHAAVALGRMGETASSAVSALVRALGSKDEALRAAAARACGGIGPKAKSAVSKLRKLAEKDPSEKVKKAANQALAEITGE